MNWLRRIEPGMLMIPAMILALAPFIPEPHLWQKLKMLADGSLSRPLDIFDLLMHSSGLILVAVRLWIGGEKPKG